jgi:hypothetical protein
MRRKRRTSLRLSFAVLALAAIAGDVAAEGGAFVGSTPCNAPVRSFLGIGSREKCEVIRWDLRLGVDERTAAPTRFQASFEYGTGKALKKLQRDGSWGLGVGTPEHPDASVYELKRGKTTLNLWKVTDDLVHLLTSRRNLMVGNGGYSYTLNPALADPSPGGALPEMSYKLLPLASGAKVFGVFEGRTPCEFFREFEPNLDPACLKVKWRLTLFRGAKRTDIANYRVEGGLFPGGAREGTVTVLPGTPFDANARVLRLDAAEPAKPLFLMMGDDNVLLFLDSAGKPGLGNRDFSYTLNRRTGS